MSDHQLARKRIFSVHPRHCRRPWRFVKHWLGGLLLTTLASGWAAAADTLTAVSWGGSYGRACQLAYYEPFTALTGIEIRMEDYNGGLAEIRAQVESGNVHWDVIDLELPDLVRACDEGLLELIDVDELPPAADGTPAKDDYFEGTSSECGGSGLFYSTVYAYNQVSFPDQRPTTIEDFFDTEKFPGRRGMRRSPLANLEFALMADGVPVESVYAVLDTPEGIERSFRKLDTIKDEIVWWETGAQPPQMLADREVVMSTAYNGRIFNAQVLEKQPFTIVWDAQILASGQIGIVAGTPRLEAARRFVQFASRVESMAAISKYISYSPIRHSGTSMVSRHLETGVDMAPHMPTNPENMQRALRENWEWWSDNGDEMNERFSAWLLR